MSTLQIQNTLLVPVRKKPKFLQMMRPDQTKICTIRTYKTKSRISFKGHIDRFQKEVWVSYWVFMLNVYAFGRIQKTVDFQSTIYAPSPVFQCSITQVRRN